jgi:hypothetical protein
VAATATQVPWQKTLFVLFSGAAKRHQKKERIIKKPFNGSCQDG